MVSVTSTRTRATEPSPPRFSPVSVEKVFAPDGSGNRFARGEEAGERGDEEDEIETDRDSFTPATTTAGRRRLILESAWTFTDHRAVPDGHSLPELIGRYGLTDRLELRLGWNYEVGGATGEATGHSIGVTGAAPDREIERESNASYGLKYQVNKQQSWLPESAVIVQGFTPTSGEETATQVVGTYVIGWQLTEETKLDAAMRYGTGEEMGDHFNIFAPSIVLKSEIAEGVTAHIEYFSIFSSHQADNFERHYISPGVHYLVTPDCEIGVRVGWGLNDQSSKFFCNIGIGWRL